MFASGRETHSGQLFGFGPQRSGEVVIKDMRMRALMRGILAKRRCNIAVFAIDAAMALKQAQGKLPVSRAGAATLGASLVVALLCIAFAL